MKRIIMCGLSGSGKTCYLYGMLRKMMIGVNMFTVDPREMSEDGSNAKVGYEAIIRACKRLGDTNLPMHERLPVMTQKIQRYQLDLKYAFETLETFEWMDYPGEILEHDENNPECKRFLEYLDDADCLFICVDGAHINGEKDEIVETLINQGGFELNKVLQTAANPKDANSAGGLPPVCIIITKFDKVDEEYRGGGGDKLMPILKEVFPVLLEEEDGGFTRMVSICPVTLGKDIENNGKLNPKAVEIPLCFVAFLSQSMKINALQEQIELIQKRYENEVKAYNNKGFFKKLFAGTPRPPMTEEEANIAAAFYVKMKTNLDKLKGQIEVMPLFINGKRQEWE